MPILRKFSQKSIMDFCLHVIGQNCVTWPSSHREAGKYDFVDKHIGGSNKLALETEEVQGCSYAAGSK